MSGMEDGLGEFLLARLTEDESAILTASGSSHGATLTWGGVTVWSADRATAEVGAKRRIVGLHRHVAASPTVRMYEEKGERPFGCVICADHDGVIWPAGWCETLSLLALPYADHKDYRAEWLT
jgi:hypothetical protein